MGREKNILKEESTLAGNVKRLRTIRELSQRQLAEAAGISFSAISKIENNQLSPTYDSLTRLAYGLQCDLTELFNEDSPQATLSRRSITRKKQGVIHKTENYNYELLCNDITHKKITPLRVEIKSREVREFGRFSHHEGEELIFVLSGTVEVHTEFYQPEILTEGDCIYLDSTMKHACLNKGDEDAVVLWVCSSPNVEELICKSLS